MLHAHTPLSMSLCHVNFPGKMQTSLPSQVYMPNTFEGHGVTEFDATHFGPILELRKEKSRDAARSRRGKENYEFYELAKMLPLPAAITSQLDKASIIRLTISYLKLRDFSSHGDPPWQRDGPPPNKAVKGGPPRRRNMQAIAMEIFETHQGTHVLQSLDGFTFALSNDGRFLYISETVSIYLGLSQVEMTGSTIFDYVHVQDHQEMAEQLGLAAPQSGTYPSPGSGSSEEGGSSSSTTRAVTPTIPERGNRFASIMNPNPSKGYDRCFCIRMKSTLTKRGVHIKSSGYRVVQILAHMRPQIAFTLGRKHPPPLLGLVAVAIALPPPTITELLIDNDMFVTRLSPDLKVTYCEPRISDMMDISADDLTNKNLYDYCHAEDLQKVRKAHVDLLNKGQVLTDYYRLMNKHGGFVWIQTCATVICNAKNAEEQNIIAINYVLSGIEYGGCVMDMNQYKLMTKMEPDQSDQSENENGSEKDDKHDQDRKSPGHHGDRDDLQQTHRRKRRHSSSHDDTSSGNHDIIAVESRSPSDEFDRLLGHAPGGTFNGDVYCDDKYSDKNKTDINKNSRRKCEKPRKMPRRKSESDGERPEAAGESHEMDAVNTDSRDGCHVRENGLGGGSNRPGSVHSNITPTSPLDVSGKLRSPVPEDLSIPRVCHSPLTTTQSPQSHRTLTPVANPSSSLENGRDNWVTNTSAASDSPVDPAATGSSVLDLEKAMNKHLPTLPSESEHLRAGLVSEYGQSMLSFQHKHNSTIKWIGSQHSPSADQLPATNFLKSLYANRESVIRTNIHNPRPQYYTGDMQNSLLTPPGVTTDPYKDSYGTPQISQSKTPPSSMPYSLMGYSSSPISVSMAPNMVESYAMTPPSSVSPQEKYSSPFVEQLHGDTAMRQYESSLTMPIKPQAYPLPAHSNSHMSAYERSAAAAAAQYPGAGYYGATSGFPTYNHASSPAPAHYRDATKTSNTW